MATSVLAADIGRTTCRLARYERDARVALVHRPCGVSLSDAGGVAAMHDVISAALRALPAGDVTAAVFGITGAAPGSRAAEELAAVLRADLGAPVAVVGDVVAAHAGALGGGPGVLTISGTGAIALAVRPDGRAALVDGWGPVLGDAGSAVDVGRSGLGAAMRAHDGRSGGSPALAAAAEARFGDLDGLPGRLHADAQTFRTVATFATEVAGAARAGDPAASAIFAAAVAALTDTTLVACRHVTGAGADAAAVVFAGGMFAFDDLVTTPVRRALAGSGVDTDVRPALGDALDGAHALAVGSAGLHHTLAWERQAGRAPEVGHAR
jgi:N-acetylglucosamine kinase-like BadF-type ATPase